MLLTDLKRFLCISTILCAITISTLPIPIKLSETSKVIASSKGTVFSPDLGVKTDVVADGVHIVHTVTQDLGNHLSGVFGHVVEQERRVVETAEAGVKSGTVSAYRYGWHFLLKSISSLFQCPNQHDNHVTTQTKGDETQSGPEYLQDAISAPSHIPSSAVSTTIDANATLLGESAYTQTIQTPGQQSWLIFRHPSTLVIAILTFITTALLLICAGTLVFRYCMNPRRRADRAARREERSRRKMYRSAACRYRIQQFFAVHFAVLPWLRRDAEAHPIRDENEKQLPTPVPNADDLSNHVLGASILSMQDTTIFVDRFLHSTPYQKQHADAQSTTPSERTQTTLPAYSLPPDYSQELPTDPSQIHIVAGFAYTPSNSGVVVGSSSSGGPASNFSIDDNSAESSAVDLDSRLSEDTDTDTDAETDSVVF